MSVYSSRSQKAHGIAVLKERGLEYFNNTSVVKSSVYPYCGNVENFPYFARPCPRTPRHGFVESRLVNTQEEFSKLIEEVKAAGENKPEIVVAKLFPAEYSGVLTSAGLSIGPGNDGATSGKGSIFIPSPSKLEDFCRIYKIKLNDYWIDDFPYVEFVSKGLNAPEAVQVRDGPKLEIKDRFIPEKIIVETIVKAEGDLLEWEKKAANFQKGTVVWHHGGTMASHYAVHCVLNKVPIVCTPESPKIGDELLPNSDEKPNIDYKMIAELIPFYDNEISRYSLDEVKKAADICVATLHSMTNWGGETHLIKLRAYSIAAAFRLSAIACLGELRHYERVGPGMNSKVPITEYIRNKQTKERHEVFFDALQRPFADLFADMKTATQDFLTQYWKNGMGGHNWANCSYAAFTLGRKIAEFYANPDEKTYAEVAGAMNKVIHEAHNGGVLFNKFIDWTKIDMMSTVPSIGFLSGFAIDLAFRKKNKIASVSDAFLNGLIKVAEIAPFDLPDCDEKCKCHSFCLKEQEEEEEKVTDELIEIEDDTDGESSAFTYPVGTHNAQVRQLKNSEIIRLQLQEVEKNIFVGLKVAGFVSTQEATKKSLAGTDAMYVPCVVQLTETNMIIAIGDKTIYDGERVF